jgi:hypothetical protein
VSPDEIHLPCDRVTADGHRLPERMVEDVPRWARVTSCDDEAAMCAALMVVALSGLPVSGSAMHSRPDPQRPPRVGG